MPFVDVAAAGDLAIVDRETGVPAVGATGCWGLSHEQADSMQTSCYIIHGFEGEGVRRGRVQL